MPSGSPADARPGGLLASGRRALKRLLEPPRRGLSGADDFELRLLTVGAFFLASLGIFVTVVFPLLLGFEPLTWLVNAGATVGMAAAYLFARRGNHRASSWILLGALFAGIWAVTLRNANSPMHEMFVLANLLPITLAFTLRRNFCALVMVAVVLAYIAYHVAVFHDATEGLSVAVVFLAGVVLAGVAPVLRAKEREHADQAERQHQAVQADYQSLFANMTEGFAHCRMIFEDGLATDWEYLRVNQAFGPLAGLADAAGKRVSQLIPGFRDASPTLFDRYARIAKGGKPEQFEVEVPALNRWFAVSAYHAGPNEFAAVFSNITQRKRSEEALRRSEALLNDAQTLSKVGGWEMDVSTGRASWTREVCRIHDVPDTFDPGDGTKLVELYDTEDRAKLMAAATACVQQAKPYDLELRLTTPKGRRVVVRSMARPEMKDGKVVRVLGSTMDITALKEAEAARKELLRKDLEVKRLEELNKMRMEFLNSAAHDLKTPLTPLKLQMAALRMRGTMDPEQKASMDLMERNVARFQVLVDDMLDAARLQAGHLKLRREPVMLPPLVQEAADSFQEPAKQGGLALTVDSLPEARIDADPAKVVQVLMNVVSNAVKYTPVGGAVHIQLEAGTNEAVVKVQDSGLGMTPEQLGKLFQPFVRLHEAIPGVAKGTGLGLYICKGIVEQHGGRLWAESEGPGKGSTFFVAWPLAGDGVVGDAP